MSTPVGSSGPSTSTPEGPSTSTSEGSSTSTSAGPSTSTLHVPSSSRKQLPSPTGSSTENAFREKERCKVQMNLFKVDISGMPEKVVRLSMLTTLCFEKCFLRLSNVHNHFSGGLNATNRRVALRVIFRKIFARHPIIFGTDIDKYAFDGATTIYAIDYKGGNLKILETLAEKDFNKEEWAQVSRIVRKPETRFEVVISANGFVYSRGQEYESIENHKELIKLIDAVSSENRNEPGIFHHGRRQTFHYKDRLRNITKGFFKSTRWLTNCEIAMVLDYVQTPFYDETSVLKLLTLKYDEFSGIAPIQIPRDQGQRDRDQREQRAHRDEQDSRDFRGHRGHEGRREGRSKSRSPIQAPEQPVQEAPDYDETKVIEVQTAFKDERHPEIFKDIARYMKGIIVEPTHLSAEYNRNVVIAGFSVLNAKEQKFIKKEGTEIKRITVVEYFKSKHNITIKFPDLPLIVTGKGKKKAYFPMELLKIVPGQRIKVKKESAVQKSLMAEKNVVRPRKFMKIITSKIWEAYCRNNPYLKSFGIKVNEKPIELEAKVIYPAELVYDRKVFCQRDDETFQFLPPNKTKFFKPAEVQKIVVINFDDAIENPDDLKTFCEKLYTKCSDNGMTMTTQPDTWTRLSLPSEEIGKLELRMRDFKRQNVTIIIGVTKERKPTVHDVLKYFEATLGIPTLHIHIDTANHFINMIKGDETIQNVIRKLNPKCGGINFLVEPPESVNGQPVCSNIADVKQRLFSETQFIGFEMIHGSAETLFNRNQKTLVEEPTFVGCSYSLELATDLGGFNYLQEFNEYKLKNVEDKIEECLNHYNTAVGRFPKTVVVFRTGAGEDDFKRVQEEVVDMKKVLEDKNIKLVVLLVQKTSRIRIFPAGITGAQQNVKSGTVIDDTITSPGRNEFIMVSQTAKKGTARPIRYTEVVNEPEWTKDELYHLTYFLAFGHQVSYQPPAVPNVVYAAENLVKRGRNNFLVHCELGNLETTITDVLEEHEDPNDREFDEHILDEINYTLNGHALVRRNFWA